MQHNGTTSDVSVAAMNANANGTTVQTNVNTNKRMNSRSGRTQTDGRGRNSRRQGGRAQSCRGRPRGRGNLARNNNLAEAEEIIINDLTATVNAETEHILQKNKSDKTKASYLNSNVLLVLMDAKEIV